MFSRLLLSFVLLLSTMARAQELDGGNLKDKTITYPAPNGNFIPLTLQTHMGKLRFGEQDNYWINPDGTYVSSNSERYKEKDKDMTLLIYEKQGFLELMKMKYLDEVYALMDKDLFTKRSNNMYDEDKKSLFAQQHLLKVANFLTSKTAMSQYFCNTKTEDCESLFSNENYYYKNIGHIINWGGKQASEFQQLRSYTSFVSEHLGTLQKWSKTILPNEKTDGFLVVKTTIGTYDFKDQGYWLHSNQFNNNNNFLIGFRNLEATNTNERKLAHPYGVGILYEMPPDRAESFSENHQTLYLVFDVSVQFKGLEYYQADKPKMGYSLNSPIITLYTDDDLTQKVGELDINTMTTKTR